MRLLLQLRSIGFASESESESECEAGSINKRYIVKPAIECAGQLAHLLAISALI